MSKLDKYNEIRSLIQTGDIMFFSGTDEVSNLIKNVTHSSYSHVGIAIWSTVPYTTEDRLFIIESTTLNNVPDMSGQYKRGVQMIAMSQRLDGYNGNSWWNPLKYPLALNEKVAMAEWLFQKYSSNTDYDMLQAIESGIDFESKIWKFLRLSWLFRTRQDLKKLFCSELVCKALQLANRIPPYINPSEQTPADIASMPIFKDSVQLI